MDETGSLESRIMAAMPGTSRSYQKLARFILDNGLFVAFASASELGDRNDVSAATVVRFCQSLGYEGYPELQSAVRTSLPTYLAKVQRLEKERQQTDRAHTPERVFALDLQNLKRTIEALDSDRFASAVDALSNAKETVVIAGGICSAPALYFAHSLKVIGLNARPILNGGIPLALDLVSLNPSSVVIGIGVWRYVAETVSAMDAAQKAGAARIAITDSLVSPLAQRADFAFQVATDGAAHALSLSSTMALINAFIAALSVARPTETERALRALDTAYRERRLLFME